MKRNKITIAAGLLLSLLSMNASASYGSIDDIGNLQYEEKAVDKESASAGGQRSEAQRDAALSVGAQYGYLAYMNALKAEIKAKEANFDVLFDFNTLMKLVSDGYDELYMLPPVVMEINDSIQLSDDAKTIKLEDRVYQILKQERLVTSAPNWRQYLLYDRDIEIVEPANVLLPKTIGEGLNWKEWVFNGYESGMRQADREMKRRAENLGVDYNGMLRYSRLTQQNKINKPVVVSSYNEVIGNGKRMAEGERIIKLQVESSLNSNSEEWEALILDTRDSLRMPIERPEYNSTFN
ncbi:type IV secretory system conjugative DNA transfer family protein [Vibrio splendidus]|nr:type IV secretory system conjugative DNA transfer family protein [Vibrio splendidus]MCC4883266.1 type IV secretion system DotC family protein [Vibrio splendidus]